MKRIATVCVALVVMLSLGGCMGFGPMLAVEAVDDMIVDVVPEADGSRGTPEFNLPFVGDLHEVDWSWGALFPWNWFNQWTFSSEGE